MKRFFTWFVASYVVICALYFYLFWFVPDQFPWEPLPKGLDAFFAFTGPAVGLFLMCATYPTIFFYDGLMGRVHFIPAWVIPLAAVAVSAALWASLILGLFAVRQCLSNDRDPAQTPG